MRVLIILYLLLGQTYLYGQKVRIEGQWRRIDLAEKSLDSHVQHGDLLLNSDSTFIMVGDDNMPKIKKPGWHGGGTIKGFWTFSHNILSFKMNQVKVLSNYQVLSLTKSELIFVHPLQKSVQLKFKRIKESG
jgi:hypothetical protein